MDNWRRFKRSVVLFLSVLRGGDGHQGRSQHAVRDHVALLQDRDHGVGFDPRNLVQPKIEEKLKASSKRGWGLKIIEGLMDEVDVRSGIEGTEVVMRKAVSDRD